MKGERGRNEVEQRNGVDEWRDEVGVMKGEGI